MVIKVTYNVTDVYVSENVSPTYINISYEAPIVSSSWGTITGTLSNQTDLQNALNAKFDDPTGTTSQYIRGDGTLATFTAGGGTWGSITGTLSNQTDLQNALNAKYNNPTGTTSQYLRGDGTLATFPTITSGTVTSVGLTMPSAFSVAGSPVTSSGTLAVTGAGTASQYIRGDGQLANFPDNQGGGSSVNYYLNGSVTQGTFGGVTYYEMSKTPILGAGTNFTRTNGQGNGYIASFITDAGDPSLLNIPAGNWNVEFYFQSSASGGSPQFYGELYKVDASNNFTLLGSGSTNPEGITNGTTIDQYFTSIPVPQTSLLVTDRLAIRIFVIPGGRTITLHTENSNLCEVITTLSTGLNALNGLTSQVQYFATGTSGTDFAISSATDTHTFNLPTASATNRGALSSADWTTFNNKQAALGFTPVTNARTLTINGVTQNLSADRSWTVDSGLKIDHLIIKNDLLTGLNGSEPLQSYNNGTGGVGAVLYGGQIFYYDDQNQTFNINGNGAGNDVSIGQTILVVNRTNAYENGLYYYARVESIGDNYGPVLERMSAYDQPSDFATSILVQIRKFPVSVGVFGANDTQLFIGSYTPVTTIGTSAITFVPVDNGKRFGLNANRPGVDQAFIGQYYYQTDGIVGSYFFNGTNWQRIPTTTIANYIVQHLQQTTYADNTTYYFGAAASLPLTTASRTRGVFNKSGILRGYSLYLNSVATPSSENVTITMFRAVGNGVQTAIHTNTFSFGGQIARVFTLSGVSTAITAGDTYEFSIQIPSMATNPTNVLLSGVIEVELT